MTWEPKKEYRLAQPPAPEDLAALSEWLLTGPSLDQGPLVRELEAAFAATVGVKNAVFVSNGSIASLLAWFLPIAVDRAEAAENRRVVVPAASWGTAVMPAVQFGYEPLLCEADPKTWGLDLEDLERLCEKAAPAIVLVDHVLGVPANLAKLRELRTKYEFLLIEDCRAAFGSPVGTVGEISVFSTRAGNPLSTVEGGFVCTGGDDGGEILRMLRDHGRAGDCNADTRARLAKASGAEAWLEKASFYVAGFNARNTDLQAHLGLSQMKRAAAAADARRANQAAYAARFKEFSSSSKDFAVQSGPAGSPSAFGVLAASAKHRAKVVEALGAKGIETRPLGGGYVGRQPWWTSYYGEPRRERPIATRIHDAGFVLPCHPGLTPMDVTFIAEAVLAVKP